MSDGITGVNRIGGGGAGLEPVDMRYDLVEFGAYQQRIAPFTPGAGDAQASVQGLGQRLVEELQITSESYRSALMRAMDPLSVSMNNGHSLDQGTVYQPAAYTRPVSAPLGVEQPLPEGMGAELSMPSTLQEISPRYNAENTVDSFGLPQKTATQQAAEESMALLMQAHSEIVKRQVQMLSAKTTMDATMSGAQSTGSNIDTLLRGG